MPVSINHVYSNAWSNMCAHHHGYTLLWPVYTSRRGTVVACLLAACKVPCCRCWSSGRPPRMPTTIQRSTTPLQYNTIQYNTIQTEEHNPNTTLGGVQSCRIAPIRQLQGMLAYICVFLSLLGDRPVLMRGLSLYWGYCISIPNTSCISEARVSPPPCAGVGHHRCTGCTRRTATCSGTLSTCSNPSRRRACRSSALKGSSTT